MHQCSAELFGVFFPSEYPHANQVAYIHLSWEYTTIMLIENIIKSPNIYEN